MIGIFERVWRVLISLKLAVLVIAMLALTLAAATVIESVHDTATAQFFFYRAAWFYVLLGLLGVNILAVALSRLPWKRRHLPFLLAHAGILLILIGSWITYRRGLDGSLRIAEGEVNGTVELPDQVLVRQKGGGEVVTAEMPWIPAVLAARFQPRVIPELGLRVEEFLSDAEFKVDFQAARKTGGRTDSPAPAIQIRILGAPMGGAPEFWLWTGSAAWTSEKLGPARFLIRREGAGDLEMPKEAGPEARLDFIAGKDGSLRFETLSLRGEKTSGRIDLEKVARKEEPVIVDPGWKMPIRIQVRNFLADAVNQTRFQPRKSKPAGMGSAQPEPAVKVSLIGQPQNAVWLGLGQSARFTEEGVPVAIGYLPKQETLPFGLRLKQFEMKTNPGTFDPSSYSSYVQVVEAPGTDSAAVANLPVRHITMNEPLHWGAFTFYQSSYVPDAPRPTITILSVNLDPGRGLKYWGSLLLILGSIGLYLSKVLQKTAPKKQTKAPSEGAS